MEINVRVKRVFDVIDFTDFEKNDEGERVHYCYACGSPLMYIVKTLDPKTKKHCVDFYCAVCGAYQGGYHDIK